MKALRIALGIMAGLAITLDGFMLGWYPGAAWSLFCALVLVLTVRSK